MSVAYVTHLSEARRGLYPFPRFKASVKGASKYIGVQAAQVSVGFVFVWGIVFALVVILSIPLVQRALLSIVTNVLPTLASATLALTLAEFVVMSYILTFQQTIVYRRVSFGKAGVYVWDVSAQ